MEGAVTPGAGHLTPSALVVMPLWRPVCLYLNPLRPDIAMQEYAPALNTGYLSPVRESEEEIIQQRGHEHLPVTCCTSNGACMERRHGDDGEMDMEWRRNASFNSTARTPPKDNHLSPLKFGVPLHSTPRKRRIRDTEGIPLTPEENIEISHIVTSQKLKSTSPIKSTPALKRCRLERTLNTEFKGPIDTALEGLSHTQLIDMIKTITYKHPEIEQEIRNHMPVPDLEPLVERVIYFLRNIFKNLLASRVTSRTTSRLTTRTDSAAYYHVATHLSAFKKCVVEQGQILVESQQWKSVIQYVFLVWNYVKAIPIWDNQPHNVHRKQCLKALTSFCMTALKKGDMQREMLVDVQNELQTMVAHCEEISSCLKYVQGLLEDFL